MENLIGLSFSAEFITFAYLVSGESGPELADAGVIEYPFDYNEEALLDEENIVRLTNMLQNEFDARGFHAEKLAVTIEANMAYLKRVAVPAGLNRPEMQAQVVWELEQSMPEPLRGFSMIKTNNIITGDGYEEPLIIMINKRIRNAFENLASLLQKDLESLSVSHLVLEAVFNKSTNDSEKTGLAVMVKVTGNRLEQVYLLNGEYYTSFYERILPEQMSDELIVEKINDRVHRVEGGLEAIQKMPVPLSQLFLYGGINSPELLSKLKDGVSDSCKEVDPCVAFNVSNRIQESIKESSWSGAMFTECFGVSFDI